MKTQNGFTLFERTSEIGPWLKKQKVTRTINKLQVHHMDSPNYSTFLKIDKKYLMKHTSEELKTIIVEIIKIKNSLVQIIVLGIIF